VLLLIIKRRESGTMTNLDFRRKSKSTDTDSTKQTGKTTTTSTTSNTKHGESTTITARETENMKLSLWEQTKLNLKKATKSPLNWIVGFWGTCAGITFNGISQFWFIPFFMVKYEYSRTLSSILVGVALAGSAVGVISYGELVRRFGPRKPLLYCGIAMFSTLLIVVYVPDLPLSVLIVLSIVIGCGLGAVIIMFTLAREYNWYYGSEETATALINMLWTGGGFIGQYGIGALLDFSYERRVDDITTDDASREYTASDYQFAFSVAPVVVLLMFIFALFFKETNGKNLTYDDEAGGEKRVGKEETQSNIQMEESP